MKHAHRRRSRSELVALPLVLLMGLAACSDPEPEASGGSPDTVEESSEPDEPTTTGDTSDGASEPADTEVTEPEAEPVEEPSEQSVAPEISGTVVVNSSGGSLHDVYRSAWWDPFTAATGVEVRDTSPVDLTLIQQQVETGNVEMGTTTLETGGDYLRAAQEGLLEPLDVDKLEAYLNANGSTTDDMADGSVGEFGVWSGGFSTILVFDERVFPDGGPQPTSVKDLWNTTDFPGKRCVSSYAQFSLEMALYADGQPLDEIYPIDTERALAKWEEIRDDIVKFWSAGAEPIQLVTSGECVMSTVWNGRPFAAATLDGIDYLGVAWDGGIFHTSWWVFPKGAQNIDAAYAVIAWYLLPDVGAGVANETGYTNANTKTIDLVSDEARPYIASSADHLAVTIQQDDQWWLDNGAATEDAYAVWIGG